jgi:geranylgeranyl pyrophosphate synthase
MAASSIALTSSDFSVELRSIEAELRNLLRSDAPDSAASDTGTRSVHDAMVYATLGGGKRVRPLLAMRVAQLTGNVNALSLRAAAAVEIFHCASLIIDDLPCMDNERERRGKPTAHVAFGEPTAVLAAFGMVALASRCVLELPFTPGQLPPVIDFQKRLLRTLDCSGLIAGQARDLTLGPSTEQNPTGQNHRAEVNEMKTVPLFELAVEAGMLGADLSAEERTALRLFSREFGRAFQFSDDLLDGDLDHRQPFLEHLSAARRLISGFGERKERILALLDYLNAYADQKNHCHR